MHFAILDTAEKKDDHGSFIVSTNDEPMTNIPSSLHVTIFSRRVCVVYH